MSRMSIAGPLAVRPVPNRPPAPIDEYLGYLRGDACAAGGERRADTIVGRALGERDAARRDPAAVERVHHEAAVVVEDDPSPRWPAQRAAAGARGPTAPGAFASTERLDARLSHSAPLPGRLPVSVRPLRGVKNRASRRRTKGPQLGQCRRHRSSNPSTSSPSATVDGHLAAARELAEQELVRELVLELGLHARERPRAESGS